MGIGTIVESAHAAAASSALRSWGSAIAGQVEHLTTSASHAPQTLEAGIARLAPMAEGSIRASGWELRSAFAWRNDDRCIQRAAFGAMSVAERATGSLERAVGSLGRDDAVASALAVTYTPNFGNARLHAAAIARSSAGETFAIDHLVAGTDDGVIPLTEWMRRVGATPGSTRVYSALDLPPLSLHAGPGIPVLARPVSPELWRAHAEHLATAWTEAAQRRLPQLEPLRNAGAR